MESVKEAVKYDGEEIRLGGVTYVAPPMTLKTLRAMLPKLEKLQIGKAPSAEDLDVIFELIHVVLLRNYPHLERSVIEDELDVKNMGPVIEAVMRASGLEQGKVTAATENQLTGPDSTGT